MPSRALRSSLAVTALALVAGCAGPGPSPSGGGQPLASSKPEQPPRPVVVLLTDFGRKEDAPALLHAAVLTVSRDAAIVDLTHDVPRFDIAEGARVLVDAPGYFPPGTAFACVIDPGVGTSRKSIAMRLKNGRYLIGPDNGLLSLAAERWGVDEVREITDPRFMAAAVSTTFHGRDVYAPAAAQLALGKLPFTEIGPQLSTWMRLEAPPPVVEGEAVRGVVTAIDEPFGNVWTNVSPSALEKIGGKKGDALVLALPGRTVEARWVDTFGDVPEGKPLAYLNSRGALSLALNMGDAARTYGVKRGDPVRVAKAR